MSVVAVAPVDRPGGAEIVLLRLLGEMQSAGWGVTVTTPGAGAVRDAARRAGFAWAALPVGGLGRGEGARAVASWPAARRLARRHTVTYLNGTVSARLLPAVPRGRRTVLHVHDLVERVPRLWRRADVVLVPSQAVAERLPGLPTHVIGCPIEPDPAPVAPPWQSSEAPIVGYVGRIEPRKGVIDLVNAAESIRAAGARVVLVGDDAYGSDPAYAEAVRTSAAVEHYGWVANAAGLMKALDVLVLPSHQEPGGTVLGEALNAGTPVVATRVGGLAEVVEDGVNGRLVAPGDPDALAAAVIDVLSHREAMGAAGREAAKRLHADVCARRVMELLTA